MKSVIRTQLYISLLGVLSFSSKSQIRTHLYSLNFHQRIIGQMLLEAAEKGGSYKDLARELLSLPIDQDMKTSFSNLVGEGLHFTEEIVNISPRLFRGGTYRRLLVHVFAAQKSLLRLAKLSGTSLPTTALSNSSYLEETIVSFIKFKVTLREKELIQFYS